MQNRIKQIRKEMNKTQQEFADFLGISFSNLASYESGRRNPSDGIITLIAEKTSYRKEWIKDGTGDPQLPKTRQEEIAELASMLYGTDPNSIKYKIMMYLKDMTVEEWEVFEKFLTTIAKEL